MYIQTLIMCVNTKNRSETFLILSLKGLLHIHFNIVSVQLFIQSRHSIFSHQPSLSTFLYRKKRKQRREANGNANGFAGKALMRDDKGVSNATVAWLANSLLDWLDQIAPLFSCTGNEKSSFSPLRRVNIRLLNEIDASRLYLMFLVYPRSNCLNRTKWMLISGKER